MNPHYNQNYTREEIDAILSKIKSCVEKGHYIISQNENRQENIDFINGKRPSFPCCQWALKKQPLQRLLKNIIYLLGTLVYSMASIFELFQHPIRLLEACA